MNSIFPIWYFKFDIPIVVNNKISSYTCLTDILLRFVLYLSYAYKCSCLPFFNFGNIICASIIGILVYFHQMLPDFYLNKQNSKQCKCLSVNIVN